MIQRWQMALISALMLAAILLTGCSSTQPADKKRTAAPVITIVFADAEWESIKLHNRIAGYIIEHGYGYQVSYLNGENAPLFKALSRGDVDIMMEVWSTDYPELWEQMIKSSKVTAVGTNYTGTQGWFVPAYMVEGDAERGIEPVIPNFKSIKDLPAYQQYFRLSATSTRGVVYNAPTGWPAAQINSEKFDSYALKGNYVLIPVTSEDDLAASLDKAYERGNSWLGYARIPGLISAGHKLWQIREEPYNEDLWNQGRSCHYPEAEVMIAANFAMNQKAPEVLDFLRNYKTTRTQNEDMLKLLDTFNGDRNQAVEEWLLANPDVWSQWLPEKTAEKVWKDLNSVPTKEKSKLK